MLLWRWIVLMLPSMSWQKSMSVRQMLDRVGRFLFFTGKGGVGKTSLACATAVALADRGKRVLLVSTDPASNLDEVLGTSLGRTPVTIPGNERLQALNLDPQAAAEAYRQRLIEPMRGQLPESILRSMEEQLSGACTTEIAAFDEFTQWLGDPASTEAYDHVIFDTAPTGHTLRLLALPGAWTGFLNSNQSGTSCLGPLAGLEKQRAVYEAALAALRDGNRSTLILVSRPQTAALAEAERASRDLAALGVDRQWLFLNGVFQAQDSDPIAMALQRRGEAALASRAEFLNRLPVVLIPLRSRNLVGLHAVRALLMDEAPSTSQTPAESLPALSSKLESLASLVDALAQAGRGVIMTMGKGGVGKTTLAAAIAARLAARGLPVHLSTTDPAAHVAFTVGHVDGLEVSRIDPRVETEAYVEQVLATTGPSLDTEGRALLEEDLRSPCTEEIAVFRAFARTVALGADRFVVLDTAPTGHTLLLLDATEAYHREIARKASDLPAEVRELLPRLRDPLWTRVLVVTVPEPTPVHEAAALQADLRRARIEPFAWILNQSLTTSGTRDPLLAARAAAETPYCNEVTDHLAHRVALVPWVPEEPVGPRRLLQFFEPEAASSRESKHPASMNTLPSMPLENEATQKDAIRQQVRSRYGEIARLESRGCGPSCCSPDPGASGGTDALKLGYSPADLANAPEGAELGLGCGNPTALASIQPGETVVDLGSGGGFDCFVAARRVGDSGRIIGVDMTPDMISKARGNAARGGYANVEFRLGEIEALPVADQTADLILSNCVVNLSPDKPRVYREAFRVLKPGGRLAISDIVALQPIPSELKTDFAAYTGCVAGASSPAELESMLRSAGFSEIQVAIQEASRAFINDWLPGKQAGAYVASASITARRPAA